MKLDGQGRQSFEDHCFRGVARVLKPGSRAQSLLKHSTLQIAAFLGPAGQPRQWQGNVDEKAADFNRRRNVRVRLSSLLRSVQNRLAGALGMSCTQVPERTSAMPCINPCTRRQVMQEPGTAMLQKRTEGRWWFRAAPEAVPRRSLP